MGSVLSPVAGDAPSFSALRLYEGGPTCAGAFLGILAWHYLHRVLEKSSANDVQLSTRASASALRSVEAASVGLTPLASQQGSSNMATSNWRLCHGLLRGGAVSRGSSTESAKVILLQGGDASEASATESARATLLQSRDASIQLLRKNH